MKRYAVLILIIFIAGGAFIFQENEAHQLAEQESTDSLVYDTAPRWSKNEDRILFYSYRNDPTGAELYAINPDRSALQRLTNTYHNEWWSDASVEGDIIYTSSDRDKSERFGGSEIYAIKPNGTYERLTQAKDTTSFNIYPRVSPDGTQLLYCANCLGKEVDSEVMLLNIDGSNPENLSDHPSMDKYGTWSPDGSKVLFSSNRTGSFDLYVLDMATRNIIQLTDNAHNDIHGDWSINNEIVFVSDRDGDEELFIMNADGTIQRQLTFNDDKDVLPSWSAKGDRIAFSSYRYGEKNTGDIFLINRDGTNEMRITMQ